MKKNFVKLWNGLLMALVCVCFAACSSDDESGVGSEELIYGTWQCVQEEGYESGEYYKEKDNYYWYFSESGRWMEFEYDDEDEEWWTYSKTYTIACEGKNELSIGSWGDYEILTLTSKKLVVKDSWTYHGEEEYQIITFKKVSNGNLYEEM